MSQTTTQKVEGAIGAIASLIPYVGQFAALVPAITTLTGFVEDTIHIYHNSGEMTDQERADELQSLNDLKSDPGWQTDAERGVGSDQGKG